MTSKDKTTRPEHPGLAIKAKPFGNSAERWEERQTKGKVKENVRQAG